MIVGEDPEAPPLPEVEPTLTPLEALGQAMIPYLERPPCLVSFSGGRDSSAVLAVATAVARREGFEAPIPITQLYPKVPGTDESYWQELMIRHLRLPDWHRQVVLDELDLLGPLATTVLRRHGVLAPSQAYGLLPLLRQAQGGSLLTGFDGDSILRTWRWVRAASVLAGQVRPVLRDIPRVAHALAPATVRARRIRRGKGHEVSWLHPEALEVLDRAFFQEASAEPFSWRKRIEWLARRRYLKVAMETHELMSREGGARILHPLLDRRFLASLAVQGGRLGFGELPRLMRKLFGSVLPTELLARDDKAGFEDVYWEWRSHEFIAGWAGAPMPIQFVDECALLETWRDPSPHMASATVLHALWLAIDQAQGSPARTSVG